MWQTSKSAVDLGLPMFAGGENGLSVVCAEDIGVMTLNGLSGKLNSFWLELSSANSFPEPYLIVSELESDSIATTCSFRSAREKCFNFSHHCSWQLFGVNSFWGFVSGWTLLPRRPFNKENVRVHWQRIRGIDFLTFWAKLSTVDDSHWKFQSNQKNWSNKITTGQWSCIRPETFWCSFRIG